jgi:hypothetical protein
MSPVRPSVQLIGRSLDPGHHRLRDFLTRIAQPYEFFEQGSPDTVRLLAERGLNDVPQPIVIEGEKIHAGATVRSLARPGDTRCRQRDPITTSRSSVRGRRGWARLFMRHPTVFARC